MKRKPTVTVAIPAYNEEKSILKVLEMVKKQKNTNHKIAAIFVYSDGSTDSTVSLVKKNHSDVKVRDFKKNLGKNRRVNQIMKENTSDVLIQVDADIKILNDQVFNHLVSAILKDEKIGIACAYHLAIKPQNLVGNLSYFGFQAWDAARSNLGKKGIRYYCEGGLRAFSKQFAQEFRLPEGRHIGEDSYSFYYAVTHGYKVVVSKRAKVYIDLAQSFNDYIKQMKRFLLDPGMINEYFDDEIVRKFETMTTEVKIKSLIFQVVKNPIVGFSYLCLQSAVKLSSKFFKPEESWVPISRV